MFVCVFYSIIISGAFAYKMSLIRNVCESADAHVSPN